ASCESMSGIDSASSACLAAARGQSVETVVAPEFVLEPEVRVRRGIAIDEAYWQTSGEAARRALVSARDHVGFGPALVAGSGPVAAPQRAWQNLRSRLESLVALVTADSAVASSTLACGAMPVVVVGRGGESLHRRAGFDACLVMAPESAEAWVR